ncbi:MAG TPA: AbrB/MazE/SpoVT family DNA-binding domain-containing protein [Acidimicrobiales bacterium]|nr:AbrB/MazE/SpoVT family DNA-binding domain-containing protein [Acidimicrobiales bacterium]
MTHESMSAHSTSASHTLAVGERGRVVIPAEFRKTLGIGPGSTLVAHVEDGRRLVLEDRGALVAAMRGAWRISEGSTRSDLTAELLAERRAEAALEEAKISGNRAAVTRARRRLGELLERHDTHRSR